MAASPKTGDVTSPRCARAFRAMPKTGEAWTLSQLPGLETWWTPPLVEAVDLRNPPEGPDLVVCVVPLEVKGGWRRRAQTSLRRRMSGSPEADPGSRFARRPLMRVADP